MMSSVWAARSQAPPGPVLVEGAACVCGSREVEVFEAVNERVTSGAICGDGFDG